MDSGFVDISLKTQCTTGTITKLLKVQSYRNRVSSLPDELLIRILSLLPTKYAVVMCVLLRKKSVLLPWITSLDFDDFPICHCLKRPHEIQRFPSFVTFVDSVLQSHHSQCLTRFKLRVGSDFTRYSSECTPNEGCKEGCLPDLKSTQIYAWVSFPLTRCGLRELDLCIHLREPGHSQLPPEIFMYETLEVLKLDVNLGFDRVSTFRLPNLKTLRLHASLISENSFLTRLVSSCPLLEDLKVEAFWKHVHFKSISSPSLRRLSLSVLQVDFDYIDYPDFVLLDTPNLEYLEYDDNVALQYSFTNMGSLAKARIMIQDPLYVGSSEVWCQQLLIVISALSNVRHLSLFGSCAKILNYIERGDQLPVFHNLKHLELADDGFTFWDKVLVAFLNRSPNLETLVFPEGFGVCFYRYKYEKVVLEEEVCRTTLAIIPWCCRLNLKRILIKDCRGNEREINWIQFLLRHSLLLEELVIFMTGYHRYVDETTLKSTVQNLPRASLTCSIQVQ